ARDVPIVNAGIHDIEQKLRELVNDGDRRQKLGEAARHYVETHHSSTVIAQQLLEIYARPNRPLEELDWPGIWESMAGLSAEMQSEFKTKTKEINQELRQSNAAIRKLERTLEKRDRKAAKDQEKIVERLEARNQALAEQVKTYKKIVPDSMFRLFKRFRG
ncbi:MAG: hypothetical protein MK085_12095, partial [Phycisphaerales bacterium]|nr:hypothetical protein [Phycisphaerales bacterium]